MKKIILLIATLCIVNQSNADNKKKDIERLFELMNTDSIVENIYEQTNQLLTNMGQQMEIKKADEEDFAKHVEKMMSLMKQEVSWQKMKVPMMAIYEKHYSEKEIQDMIQFYQTKTGQSMIKKMPLVMQDSMQLSQQMMQELSPKLIKIMDEYEKEHGQKDGHNH